MSRQARMPLKFTYHSNHEDFEAVVPCVICGRTSGDQVTTYFTQDEHQCWQEGMPLSHDTFEFCCEDMVVLTSGICWDCQGDMKCPAPGEHWRNNA